MQVLDAGDRGPYDRESSVTNRAGAKTYFSRSLRISFRAACLLRLDWTSASRTSPSASTADMEAEYNELTNAGKPAKVALTAIMRKLIVLANALLKANRRWTLNPA